MYLREGTARRLVALCGGRSLRPRRGTGDVPFLSLSYTTLGDCASKFQSDRPAHGDIINLRVISLVLGR